jgi:hypothetical protein
MKPCRIFLERLITTPFSIRRSKWLIEGIAGIILKSSLFDFAVKEESPVF